MLPDASQDPTIRHILNDVAVAVVSVNVPSRPKLLCLSLGRLHVALIEKFASPSRPKAEKRKQIKKEKWKKNFFGHLSFDDFRLASIGSGWAGTGLVCPLVYPPDGPVLALVLSAAPSWLCRLCLCKKFVYCLLSRALPERWEEGVDLSSSMAVLLLLFLELK